jgi:hypothetical protein
VASLDPITAARAATLPGTAGSADLVLRNGRIFTGDPARPQAAALAVSAGRITASDDEADIAALAGPGTRVVDALGRRVIPGCRGLDRQVSGGLGPGPASPPGSRSTVASVQRSDGMPGTAAS